MLDFLIAVLFGVVEGITEWLPVSSTGHMILLDEFVKMNVSPAFWEMFLVVVQLGAILAVVLLFWKKIWPFGWNKEEKKPTLKLPIWDMWFKALFACIPAIIVGLLFDDQLDALFYNGICVATALIVFGIGFIVVENINQDKAPRIKTISELTYKTAAVIGLFQVIAAIFPGTSRSGATILGALLIGVSRTVAAEFTFILAIPVMFGASLLKLLKFGISFSGMELGLLLIGMATAFVVSLVVIRFFMGYIKKHDFKVFGVYRMALGMIVLVYFALL